MPILHTFIKPIVLPKYVLSASPSHPQTSIRHYPSRVGLVTSDSEDAIKYKIHEFWKMSV